MQRSDTVEMCEFVRILCLPVHTRFFFLNFCYWILAGVCKINSKPYRFYHSQRNLPLSILVAVDWKQAKRDNLFHCCITSIWFLFYTVFWQMELKNEKDWRWKNTHTMFNPLRGGWVDLYRVPEGVLGPFPFRKDCIWCLSILCAKLRCQDSG